MKKIKVRSWFYNENKTKKSATKFFIFLLKLIIIIKKKIFTLIFLLANI